MGQHYDRWFWDEQTQVGWCRFRARHWKLYFGPVHADGVLVVDPITNTSDSTEIAGFGTGLSKWLDVIYVHTTKKLYLSPYNADNVLVVDPLTNVSDTTAITGLITGLDVDGQKWHRGVFVPTTEKLYFAQRNAGNVLMVGPMTNVSDTTAISGFGTGVPKWVEAVFVPTTGKLYFVPLRSTAMLIVDPLTNVSDTIAISGFDPTTYTWAGGVFVATTGKIYLAPYYADNVLVVDPTTNVSDTTTITGFGMSIAKWYDVVFFHTTSKEGGSVSPLLTRNSATQICTANTGDQNSENQFSFSNPWLTKIRFQNFKNLCFVFRILDD